MIYSIFRQVVFFIPCTGSAMQFTAEPFFTPTELPPTGPPVIDAENATRVALIEIIEVQNP